MVILLILNRGLVICILSKHSNKGCHAVLFPVAQSQFGHYVLTQPNKQNQLGLGIHRSNKWWAATKARVEFSRAPHWYNQTCRKTERTDKRPHSVNTRRVWGSGVLPEQMGGMGRLVRLAWWVGVQESANLSFLTSQETCSQGRSQTQDTHTQTPSSRPYAGVTF